jgi:hypothetical protein
MHSGTTLGELTTQKEKIEFFLQLVEHLSTLKDIEPSMINLNPSSIVKSGNL